MHPASSISLKHYLPFRSRKMYIKAQPISEAAPRKRQTIKGFFLPVHLEAYMRKLDGISTAPDRKLFM